MRRSNWIAHVGTAASCLVVLAALAGCGVTAGHSANGQAGSNSATLTATPTVAAGSTTGRVTISLDKPRYARSDTIRVTLHNGLGVPIFAADHQSDCTLVTLQLSVNATWEPLGECRLMTPTGLVEVQAGSATLQTLAPSGGKFASSGSTWPSGACRIVFRYSVGASEFPSATAAAYATLMIA